MELRDWFSLVAVVVSIASLSVAGIALVKTVQHNASIRQYASAAPDIAVMAQITQARMTITNIAIKLAEITKGKPDEKLTDRESQQVASLQPAYLQAVEALHTCYDLACRLYRDGCLDRNRFRRQYEPQVRKLFEEGTETDRAALSSLTTPYQALRAVYDEWFNKEK